MDRTEHDKLPAMVSDYIDAVITTMRYRKKVRAEVRQELSDHFADALSDCRNDEERDALANALIARFGDAQLLGILLRRAKKRCRPLWRTVVVRMFQAVGVILLLQVAYIGWFLTGKPVITTNYVEVLNRQARPVADDAQNAWPYYKQAAQNYVEPTDKAFDVSPRPVSTLTPEHREVLLQWIADNQRSLDLIRQGNQKPHYWQIYDTGEKETNKLLSALMPHLSDYRNLARLMCWQALLKAEDSDLKSSFEDVVEVYSFGRHLRGQNTTLIEQLVAIAIETMAAKEIRGIADAHMGNIDVDLLNSSRQRFQQKIAEQNFRISFEAEKLFICDEIQRSFTQPRFGRSHLYLPRLIQQAQLEISGWLYLLAVMHPAILMHPGRNDTLEQIDQYFDTVEKLARQTPASSIETVTRLNENFDFEELLFKNLFMYHHAPSIKLVQISYRSQTDSFATLTILAILQYKKTHGDYPDSLASVVEAGLLEALPIDPFSDEPLVYRRTEDGFTLYSVGPNMTDNGGARGKSLWADDSDAVFWPFLSD